ncbi:MAG: hypothetical protein JSS75_11305 [Bacteroidetes bacterium]|nr:hypothetical protein [Bacteroidota bacterium]
MNHVIRILAVCTLLASASVAQQRNDPMEAMNHRASRLIDSSMQRLNLRAERFNEELGKINKARPLDPSMLSAEKIKENTGKINDFLAYLDVYRSLSANMRKQVDDSVAAMRSEMPIRVRKAYLQEFLDAYASDQTAFDKYTMALTNVYTNVKQVLEFISTAKVQVVDGKLSFTDKTEYEQYETLMNKVNAANRKLVSASAASQKATLEASDQMNKAYGAANK